MPISVQQFDFIAETMGIQRALAAAEEAGGVTGTRDVPTQIELGTGGVSGISGTRLSGQGGEFLPGTVVTDLSQGIGAAGTATSGQTLGDIMGGGGLAADVFSPEGRNLQDIMGMFQGDTSGFLSNAPVTATSAAQNGTNIHAYYSDGTYYGFMSAADAAFLNLVEGPAPGGAGAAAAPASKDAAQLLLDRALAGEILSTAEIAALDRDSQIAIVDQVLGNLIGELTRFAEAGDGGGVTGAYKQIFDLWQNFYEPGGEGPGQTAIVALMNNLASQRGFGENYFAGLERALETGGTEFTMPKGAQAAKPGTQFAQGQKDKISEYMLDFAGQTNDWTKALTLAARNSFSSQDDEQYKLWAGNSGVPAFASEKDAYDYFNQFFRDNPDYWQGGLGTVDMFPSATPSYLGGTGGADVVGPAADFTGDGAIPVAGTNLGGLGAAGVGGEQRGFGDVFPGFVSTSPWAGIPNVGSAISQAGPFFQSQFGMVSPFIPETGIPAGESRAGNWLRGLSTGETGLLRGGALGERLQDIGTALGDPMSGTIGEGGLGVVNPLRGAYFDPKTSAPGSQIGAVQNPFILATRGAPTSRALALQAIQKAATDFSYKYPSGIPIGEGTAPEQFLPFALRTNLMGIRDLPEFQGMNWG